MKVNYFFAVTFIFLLFFLSCDDIKRTSLDDFRCSKKTSYPAASYKSIALARKNNSLEWHCRNDHLIPDEKQTQAILSLNQNRDFASLDIDRDGLINTFDPSVYDWREIGYQPFAVLAFLSWRHSWNNYKYSDKDLRKAVKLLKEAGIAFVRMDFLWQDIEPSKNNFNFDKYDFIVDLLSKENIRILGLLGYSASWAGKTWNSPPTNLEDFVDYVSNVISRYRDRVKYWEIWNEPDSRTYWQPQDEMKTYTQLLRLCYVAAKQIDPSCKILLGGMTSNGYYAINNIYKNGGRDFFDIINIHPFVDPLNPKELKRIKAIYNNLEKLKVRYKDEEKKIWFTEIGCPGLAAQVEHRGWWIGGFPTEKQQAKYLNYIYTELIKLPNLEKIFWAYFRDNKEHFKDDVDYFGLIRWDFSTKPAFETFKDRYINWLNTYKYFKSSAEDER